MAALLSRFRPWAPRAGVAPALFIKSATVPSSGLARAASSNSSGGSSSASSTARATALMSAIKQIEHSFGKKMVMQLGERGSVATGIDVISSGSLALDSALGIGGFPRGRVVEIYGPESSGKSTLALHVIAVAQ
jgi:hypothetical protein